VKKIVIAICALLAAGVVCIAIPMAGRYDQIQYKRAMEMDALIAGGDGWLRAAQGGAATLVKGDNIPRVARLITPTVLTREYSLGDAEERVKLTFSNGDTVRLLSDEGEGDRVLIEVKARSVKALFAMEGRNILEAVKEAVSPEGFSGANEIVEGE
jgi:hypothetical protein